MKLKLLAGAAMAAAFAASGAAAQEGWYGAVDLGYHWPDQFEVTSSNNAANGSPYAWELNQEDDWAGFARLGYQLNDHWRVELEVGYRGGDIDSVRGGSNQSIIGLCTPGVTRTTAAPACGSPDGDVTSWTVDGQRHLRHPARFGPQPVHRRRHRCESHQGRRDRSVLERDRAPSRRPTRRSRTWSIDDNDTAFAYQLHRAVWPGRRPIS